MLCVLQRFGFVNDFILRQIGHRREIEKLKLTTTAWLAQLGERRSAGGRSRLKPRPDRQSGSLQ